jgi:type II secretory pathway component GspD/PulD (secretin)
MPREPEVFVLHLPARKLLPNRWRLVTIWEGEVTADPPSSLSDNDLLHIQVGFTMNLPRRAARVATATLFAYFVSLVPLLAQEAVVVEAAAQAATPAAAQPMPVEVKPGGAPMPGGEGAAKPMPGQPGAKPGESGEKKKEEASPAAPVTRPKEPPAPADPAELRVRPSENGMVRFSFRNQPWPAVLQWLADVSGLSLDWQELPGDYLNLSLQRSYTLEEARDLINRHLLARGYTMILDGETLNVVNLAKLNPGLVPRVLPEELEDRQPHEVVKVSFPLGWMLAEQAAEELEPMVSTHGKLYAQKELNRLEAIDAVVNLRQIHDLLSKAQSTGGEERLVREFPLEHTRAADVKELLMELLGLESKKKPAAPMSPQEMQMAQQQAMMMAQQRAQQGGAAPAGPKKEAEVSLVVNTHRNSVLATAPPDKMAIIEEAVKRLDVPTALGESLLANMTRLQIYRLSAVDPDPIVKTLQEIGDLSPQTRLEVDTKNRAIIAYATLADHVTIRTMVEKLDGSARTLEVIPLRRLSADYVAGTLRFLLGGGEDKEERRMPYYYYYGDRGRDEKQDGFRVDADVENNRLLVWANPTELEEVISMLAKLGEIPQRGGDPRRVRTLEILPSQQSAEFFNRLQELWKATAPNELRVDPNLTPAESTVPQPRGETAPGAEEKPAVRPDGKTAAHLPRATPFKETFELNPAHLAQLRRQISGQAPAESFVSAPVEPVPAPVENSPAATGNQAASPADAKPAPIGVTRGRDGRLVISSQDPQALDLLEDLVREMAPHKKEFEVFELKYAPAFWVALNLEDFFKEEDPEDNRSSYYRYFYYDYPPESDKEDPRRLSNRRPLKFISDDDTNTIVVQGADPQQLQTITELIKLYDQAPPEDAQSRRVTQIFAIQYSRAEVIAEAVKDVYRDLLSANDKALSQQQQQQNQKPPGETYITNIGFGEESEQRERRTQVTFKGKLSIGVDTMTNTLLISTEGEALMRNIQEMVLRLDDAAKPRTKVEVLHVGGLAGSGLQKALSQVFGEQTSQPNGKPGQPGQPHQHGQPGQPNSTNAQGQGQAQPAAVITGG